MIRGLLLCVLVVPVGADTVFLNSGTAIDGVIKARHEQTLELQIGKIGRIFVELDKIESIEKNDRDGSWIDTGMALTGKRRQVEEAPQAATETPKSADAVAVANNPKDKRIRKKEDVDPQLREEIERQIYDFTREKRKFRVRATQRLKAIGESALPFLLDVVGNENPQVRIATMEIFMQNGTDLVIKDTIDRLEDENEYVRKTANEALVKITSKDLDFRCDAAQSVRQDQVNAWRTWYKELKEQEAAEAAKAAEGDKAAAKQPDAAASTQPDGAKENDPAVTKDIPKPSTESPDAPADDAPLPKAASSP